MFQDSWVLFDCAECGACFQLWMKSFASTIHCPICGVQLREGRSPTLRVVEATKGPQEW